MIFLYFCFIEMPVAHRDSDMKQFIIVAGMLLATGVSAFAGNNQGGNSQGGNNQGGNSQGGSGYHGAPGPVMGAGLPALAIGVGYGIYWLRTRRRKAN